MAVGKVLLCTALVIGYLSYVRYPAACDFPIGMKLMYSFIRLCCNLGDIAEYFGGDYLTYIRLLDLVGGLDVEGVETIKENFGGVPSTIYIPRGYRSGAPGSAVVYFHGGGFTFGSAGNFATLLREVAKNSGMLIMFPEYRLAPQYPYPIPLQDCVSAAVNFSRRAQEYNVDPNNIIFSGDSAGGALSVSTALHLARNGYSEMKPKMLNLIYPFLQISNFKLPSHLQNFDPPFVTTRMVARFALAYMGLENETGLLSPMEENLHVEGFEEEDFVKQANGHLLPEEYKNRVYNEKPAYKSTENDRALIRKYKDFLRKHASDPEFLPLSATDEQLKALPKTHVITCEHDVLRDEGIILYQRMKSLGMKVSHENLEFGAHGLIIFYGTFTYPKLDEVIFNMIARMKEN